MKSLLIALFLFITPLVSSAHAQAPWEQCGDGTAITRCETYDCPQGDTNNDGACDLNDNQARVIDARNDAFCANPVSGCGEVRYFGALSNNACGVRVKETDATCNLYSAGSPQFTPVPSVPTPSPGGAAGIGGPSTFLTCTGLTAEPTTGEAPLDVKFTVAAAGDVSNYEFDFGDGTTPFIQASRILVHRFSRNGTFTATARIAGTDGAYVGSNACTVTVTVGSGATTKGGEPIETLPETGSELYAVAALILIGVSGVFIYERFRFA